MFSKNKKNYKNLLQNLNLVYKLLVVFLLSGCFVMCLFIIAEIDYMYQKIESKYGSFYSEIQEKPQTKSSSSSKISPTKPEKTEHRFGNVDSQFSLIAYMDLECPSCKQSYPIEKAFIEQNKDISLVFRHYPLVDIHPNAQKLAAITECSYIQGGEDSFWKSVDTIYSSSQLDGLETNDLAKLLSLNSSELEKCLDQGDAQKKVGEQLQDGKKLNILGTPALFIYNNSNDSFVYLGGLQSLSDLQDQFNRFKNIN